MCVIFGKLDVLSAGRCDSDINIKLSQFKFQLQYYTLSLFFFFLLVIKLSWFKCRSSSLQLKTTIAKAGEVNIQYRTKPVGNRTITEISSLQGLLVLWKFSTVNEEADCSLKNSTSAVHQRAICGQCGESDEGIFLCALCLHHQCQVSVSLSIVVTVFLGFITQP